MATPEGTKNAERFVRSIHHLPSLPAIAEKVLAAASGDADNFVSIARLVEKDAGLSARVLKIANSSFYARLVPTSSVAMAIARMGTVEFKMVAFSAAVMNTFLDLNAFIDMPAFWGHSLASGLACRLLSFPEEASHKSVFEIDESYMAGLLHNAGILAEALGDPAGLEEARSLAREAGVPLAEAERQVFGFDHAEAGSELLRSWRFPDGVCDAALLHHSPAQEGDAGVRTVQLVRLSAMLCRSFDPVDFAYAGEAPWLKDPDFARLGWNAENSAGLSDRLRVCIQMATDFRELVVA